MHKSRHELRIVVREPHRVYVVMRADDLILRSFDVLVQSLDNV